MSNAERFDAEPSPPPQGRSTARKILFGCGMGCGVLALVCCGGAAIFGFISYRSVKDAINEDPASVQAMTAELAAVEIPAGLQPKFAINFKLPFVNKTVFKAAVYTEGMEGNNTQIFAIGEVPGAAEVDQNRLRTEIDRALAQQEASTHSDDEFEAKESHTLEVEIREQPAKFFIEEGELRKSHKKMIRAMGQFEGHEGPALLLLQLDAEQHNMEQVEELLRSIH